jgi:hypothetical protein
MCGLFIDRQILPGLGTVGQAIVNPVSINRGVMKNSWFTRDFFIAQVRGARGIWGVVMKKSREFFSK